MLQNAYFLAKIGVDTAENEQHFAEILPIGRRCASRRPSTPAAPVYALRRHRQASRPGRAVLPPRGTRGGYTVDFLAESSAYMELVLVKKSMHLIAILALFQRDIISGSNGVCKQKFTAYLLPERNSLMFTNFRKNVPKVSSRESNT